MIPENKVIELAVKIFLKQQSLGDTEYTMEDALIYALEEYDTGYDLTTEEYNELLKKVYKGSVA